MHHFFADVGGPSDPITCTEPVQLGIFIMPAPLRDLLQYHREVTVHLYNEDACLHQSLHVGA